MPMLPGQQLVPMMLAVAPTIAMAWVIRVAAPHELARVAELQFDTFAPPPEPPQGPVEKLVPADADVLLDHVRGRLRASRETGGGFAPTTLVVPLSAADTSRPVVDGSATVLQEAGVDEDDVLRLDGETVWALSPPAADGTQRLQSFRVADGGAALVPAGSLALDPAVRGIGDSAARAPRCGMERDGRVWP